MAAWSHVVSDENHGSPVAIATSLMLFGSVTFFAIRGVIRWPWKQLVGYDDLITGVGTFVAIGQSIAIFEAIRYGLGVRREDLALEATGNMERNMFIADLLSIFADAASKLAISVLLLRLSGSRIHTRAARAITVLVAAWGLAALLTVAIIPNSRIPWKLDHKDAFRKTDVWTGLGSGSIFIELLLIAAPIFLVWKLHMPLMSKFIVCGGFAFRVPVIVLTILRAISLYRIQVQNSNDISWSCVYPIIYMEIEMHYSLIAATIPCMHVFLRKVSTGHRGATADQADRTVAVAPKGNDSYVLENTLSRDPADEFEEKADDVDLDLWTQGLARSAIVRLSTTPTDLGSIISDSSDDRIIPQYWQAAEWQKG